MKTRIQPKLKKFILLSVILCSTYLFFGCLLEYDSDNYMEKGKVENLRLSPAQGLNHDDHAEMHGWAEQHIDWSYTTNPLQVINVWALDATQYIIFNAGSDAFGYLLSTGWSGSGRFDVPSSGIWYIVFWNDEILSQYTIVTYDAVFVGDTRTPSITVNEPVSSSSVRMRGTLNINWSSTNAGISVKIELYKGDTLNTTITPNTANDGYHQWMIPLGNETGVDFRVKVSSLSTSAYDFSDYFEITEAAVITLIYPYSGASLAMDSLYVIQWNNTDEICFIDIDLYRNETFILSVDYSIYNCGTFGGVKYWIVPEGLSPAGDYRLKIYDRDNPGTYIFSGFFEITDPRDIDILKPRTGSTYTQGSEYLIEWESYGPVGDVMLDLYINIEHENYTFGIDVYILTIAENTENDGNFSWVVPEVLPNGNRYFISIVSLVDYYCYDDSALFTIGPTPPKSIPGFDIILVMISSIAVALGITSYTQSHFQKKNRKS